MQAVNRTIIFVRTAVPAGSKPAGSTGVLTHVKKYTMHVWRSFAKEIVIRNIKVDHQLKISRIINRVSVGGGSKDIWGMTDALDATI